MHLALLQLQLHPLHKPRRRNAQYLVVQLTVLHEALLDPEKPSCYHLDASADHRLSSPSLGETESGSAGTQPDKG